MRRANERNPMNIVFNTEEQIIILRRERDKEKDPMIKYYINERIKGLINDACIILREKGAPVERIKKAYGWVEE